MRAALCCAVLCCAALRCAVLCCVALRCARELPATPSGTLLPSPRCTCGHAVAPLQEDPPKPTDQDVKVIDYEPIQVYVRVFGGFATESTVLEQARTLHSVLDDDDRDFDDELVWLAVYDAPQVRLVEGVGGGGWSGAGRNQSRACRGCSLWWCRVGRKDSGWDDGEALRCRLWHAETA